MLSLTDLDHPVAEDQVSTALKYLKHNSFTAQAPVHVYLPQFYLSLC